jgi:hypothetical protein
MSSFKIQDGVLKNRIFLFHQIKRARGVALENGDDVGCPVLGGRVAGWLGVCGV